MNSIFAGGERKIDWTLKISFPDATNFHFATRPLTISSQAYTNDLESVGDLRQSLESPIDRVRFAIQNKDRVLGLHVAEHWRKWRKAEIVAGRFYVGGTNMSLSEWKEMFRGSVQSPNANDFQVFFDAITDTVAPGGIVTNRTLDPACWYVYKDAKTCGYTGTEIDCNHKLKSSGGCDGKVTGPSGAAGNGHRYGGMEHRYNPDSSVPGTGGNPPGGGGGGAGGGCPRLDQFVLVKGDDGKPQPLMVCFFTDQHELFNPITKTFHRTRSAIVIKDQPIFELIASNGAVGYSSFKHPILWYKEHATGEAVERFFSGDQVLGWAKRLVNTRCLIAKDTAENADVMKIEMEDGKIYCYGDNPEKLIVCHNNKPPYDP